MMHRDGGGGVDHFNFYDIGSQTVKHRDRIQKEARRRTHSPPVSTVHPGHPGNGQTRDKSSGAGGRGALHGWRLVALVSSECEWTSGAMGQ